MKKIVNPVGYFEIPVNDMDRAVDFYKNVFGFEFDYEEIDGYIMALFPFNEVESGITGALVKGDVYKPSHSGVLIYFNTTDIDEILSAVLENNGRMLYPKTSVGTYGYVAEFEDSEGNRIGLSQQ